MIDFAIQLGGAAIFVVLVFDWLLPLPNRIAPLLLCAYLFLVGVWAYAYPPGVLGWVKRRNAQVNPEDRSGWWVPKSIGAMFITLSVLIAADLIYFSK